MPMILQRTKWQDRVCLTLASDARNWYETVRNVELNGPALQRCFRQKFSKEW